MIDVSIIIPVYYNEGSIALTIQSIKECVINNNKNLSFEIICIDDGSKDGSLNELLNTKKENDSLVSIIKLSRNFGQVPAMLAGYKASRGKCVINVSADMQDPLVLMNQMIEIYFNEKIEIIIATRTDRDESIYRKKTSQFFYSIIQKLSFKNMPIGGFDYALLGRKVVDVINNNKDANPFWQGMILWTGFSIKFIPYTRNKREIGTSKWTFNKKIKYLIDGVMAYSYFPLRAMSMMGFFVFLTGFSYAIYIAYAYMKGEIPIQGWSPLMIIILVTTGLIMLMLGVIGEYLWRVLEQVRGRQGSIIDEEFK